MTDPLNTYDKEDSVRLRVIFTVDNVPTDPENVLLRVKDPSGTTELFYYNGGGGDVVKEATGTYYKDHILDDTGRWYYRFEATGTVQASGEWSLKVRRTEF